jgi:hypothetical protein
MVFTGNDTWKDHVAFSEGVEALSDALSAIDEQNQVAQGNPGASDAKELARQVLCAIACEVIGALRAYSAVVPDPELAAKVDYTASTVTAGKASDVVARCKSIQTVATEHAADLGKYGISPAKLTKFKNAITAFDTAKSAPRQNRVTKSAAAQLLPQLVRSAVAVVRDQLDGLMVQFKDAEPNFYEEYFAARVVGASKGSRAEKVQENTNPVPSTQPAAKAAWARGAEGQELDAEVLGVPLARCRLTASCEQRILAWHDE